MGQFLPLFLQPAGLSAANDTEHIAASRIESRIFGYFVIGLSLIAVCDVIPVENILRGNRYVLFSGRSEHSQEVLCACKRFFEFSYSRVIVIFIRLLAARPMIHV